ncbi:MAG: arginine repressor [Janthinobacterium lividum]
MKTQRHSTIRELLVSTAVANQDELRRKLAGQGIHVTQATLSRDIRELKLMKGPSGYALPEDDRADETEDFDDTLPAVAEMLESFGLEVRQAQNLLVLLTAKGAAQPVGAGIDDEEWPEVVGTIAGDNTVLIICTNAKTAEVLRTRLEVYLA